MSYALWVGAYVFNLDFTHLCLDIPVPSINKDFIIIMVILISQNKITDFLKSLIPNSII